jgi:hypothetical protein
LPIPTIRHAQKINLLYPVLPLVITSGSAAAAVSPVAAVASFSTLG